MSDTSPTARALLALESIHDRPGITADRLAARLGVSERAARRYVGILREAGIPVRADRGRHGGYRLGRGLRLPPLTFSTDEALRLVMAVFEAGHGTAAEDDPVHTALSKILRVLPESVAAPAKAVRRLSAPVTDPSADHASPETIALLVQACAARQRLRLRYRRGAEDFDMVVDPWAVSIRYGRWYLLCWSRDRLARRSLRVDRVVAVTEVPGTAEPPADLDPARMLEEHLADGWRYPVEVVIEAPIEEVAARMPRRLGRLEAVDADRTRLLASTEEPDWYVEQLLAVPVPFRVIGSPELREATRRLAARLTAAVEEVRTEPDR